VAARKSGVTASAGNGGNNHQCQLWRQWRKSAGSVMSREEISSVIGNRGYLWRSSLGKRGEKLTARRHG